MTMTPNKNSPRAFYKMNGAPVVSIQNCFKMWIMPDGKVVRLPGFHREYIQAHAVELGIAITRKDDEIRLDGIEAGLFRGNYEFGNGHLTFEGQKQHLTPVIRNSLFRLVRLNLEHIGRITIHLLDDMNRCVEAPTVCLTEIDSRQARFAALPWPINPTVDNGNPNKNHVPKEMP